MKRAPHAIALLALAAGNAHAQVEASTAPGAASPVRIVPTIGLSANATNNVNLSPTDKQSDLFLVVSPGISMSGQSGRVRGFLDYTLNASFSTNRSGETSFTNALAANVRAEAVENWLFVDASASITQQYIDPFGTQSPDVSLTNSNRTEVSTVYVSPYIDGQIAGQVNYLGRVFYTFTDSGTSEASNSTMWGGLLQFGSTTRWSRLSWGADFSYRAVDFTFGRDTFDQLNLLALKYAITDALEVSLRGNWERSNVVSLDAETNFGWGGGLRWNPSPRTKLVLEYDQRIFGSSHLVSFEYRTPRTVWSVSSVQSLSTGQTNTGRGNPGSPFDLLFAQFASVEPDPVKREQLVIAFMQANGIDPNSRLNTGYLPSQVQLQDRNEASAALLGQRSTVILNAYQTSTKNLGPLSNPDNNFANANEIDWLGFGLTWAHKLTPRATLSVNASQLQTKQAEGTQDTTLRIGTVMWTNQIAERASVSVSASYNAQTGSSTYNEASVFASLNMQF